MLRYYMMEQHVYTSVDISHRQVMIEPYVNLLNVTHGADESPCDTRIYIYIEKCCFLMFSTEVADIMLMVSWYFLENIGCYLHLL